jgi:DNA-directed RNA polymerase subunit E'/Rpb7
MVELGDPIYEERILSSSVYLRPLELNTLNIDELILNKLKTKIEGKCISSGYVKPESIKILGRSLGLLQTHDFNANSYYEITFKAEICSPKNGQIIECILETKDESHNVCYVGDEETSPVEVYIYRQNNIGNTDYGALKQGDTILVKVNDTQVEFGAPRVLVGGEFIRKV